MTLLTHEAKVKNLQRQIGNEHEMKEFWRLKYEKLHMDVRTIRTDAEMTLKMGGPVSVDAILGQLSRILGDE